MFNQIPPGLKNLLILIGLFGMAQIALPKIGFDVNQLYLVYPDSPNFKIWQLITHMFCHGSISHFLFNAIALFSFGAVIEYKLGTKKFLYLYLLSGFGAVLLHLGISAVELYRATGTIMPFHDQISVSESTYMAILPHYVPMLGASGALYGVMIAFAFFYPNEKLLFLFIPYPIKAKIIVPIILAIDLIGGFGSFSGDNIAHFAHLGGALTGYLVVKYWSWKKLKDNWMY